MLKYCRVECRAHLLCSHIADGRGTAIHHHSRWWANVGFKFCENGPFGPFLFFNASVAPIFAIVQSLAATRSVFTKRRRRNGLAMVILIVAVFGDNVQGTRTPPSLSPVNGCAKFLRRTVQVPVDTRCIGNSTIIHFPFGACTTAFSITRRSFWLIVGFARVLLSKRKGQTVCEK